MISVAQDLTSKHGLNLIGCRKIKFHKAGIRIVYRIVGDKTEIAEIIIVEKREDNEVYQEAYKRLQELKRNPFLTPFCFFNYGLQAFAMVLVNPTSGLQGSIFHGFLYGA